MPTKLGLTHITSHDHPPRHPPIPRPPLWNGIGEPPVAFLVTGAGSGPSVQTQTVNTRYGLWTSTPSCCGQKRKASSELPGPSSSQTRTDNQPATTGSVMDRFLESSTPLERVTSHQMISLPPISTRQETSDDFESPGRETSPTVPAAALVGLGVIEVNADYDDEKEENMRKAFRRYVTPVITADQD